MVLRRTAQVDHIQLQVEMSLIYQASSNSVRAIYCEGYANSFNNVTVWDFSLAAEEDSIYFSPDDKKNYVQTTYTGGVDYDGSNNVIVNSTRATFGGAEGIASSYLNKELNKDLHNHDDSGGNPYVYIYGE